MRPEGRTFNRTLGSPTQGDLRFVLGFRVSGSGLKGYRVGGNLGSLRMGYIRIGLW